MILQQAWPCYAVDTGDDENQPHFGTMTEALQQSIAWAQGDDRRVSFPVFREATPCWLALCEEDGCDQHIVEVDEHPNQVHYSGEQASEIDREMRGRCLDHHEDGPPRPVAQQVEALFDVDGGALWTS